MSKQTRLKGYKFTIQLDKEQEQYFSQVAGSCRFVWNMLTANFNSYGTEDFIKFLDEKDLKDMEEYSFLGDMISYALQQKRIDFYNTSDQYFNKRRKVRIGRMNFKKKDVSKESFRIPAASMTGKGGIRYFDQISGGTIKVPKLKKPIKVILDREFDGLIKSFTFSKDRTGKWFVSILVEEEYQPWESAKGVVGIDFGLTDLFILSNGVKISNPRWFRENQSKLRKAQKALSHKVRGSNRYEKQRLKVARLHKKIVNQRNHFYHNLSTLLVKNFGTIIIEDLKVSNMIKNRNLAKSIQDASWSTFATMLDYKSRWHFRTFHKIDTWYPSSKTCSGCGWKNMNLKLSDREWDCLECGTTHDRDLNAATNIVYRGLDDLYGLASEESSDYRHGGEVRPEEFVQLAAPMKCLSSFIEIYRTE